LGFDLAEVLQRTASGERFHAAHARRERAIADDLEQADVAGAIHVAAAAELARIVAGRNDAHHLPIFLAEHRDRAGPLRFGDRHHGLRHLEVLADARIHFILDLPQLLFAERLIPGVVE